MQTLIKAISNYVKLNNDDVSIIERLFEIKEIRKDQYFLKPGHTCKNFAYIKGGLLRHYIGHNRDETTIYFSAEDDFVCDYESFLSRNASKKGIVALENTIIF